MRQQLAVISLKRADSPLILFHRAFLLQNTETVWQLECAICRGALVECLKFHEIKSESEIFTRFGTPEISELYSFLFFFFFFVKFLLRFPVATCAGIAKGIAQQEPFSVGSFSDASSAKR